MFKEKFDGDKLFILAEGRALNGWSLISQIMWKRNSHSMRNYQIKMRGEKHVHPYNNKNPKMNTFFFF